MEAAKPSLNQSHFSLTSKVRKWAANFFPLWWWVTRQCSATTEGNITGEYQRASKRSQRAIWAAPSHKDRTDKFDFSTQEKWMIFLKGVLRWRFGGGHVTMWCDLSALTMESDSDGRGPPAEERNIWWWVTHSQIWNLEKWLEWSHSENVVRPWKSKKIPT